MSEPTTPALRRKPSSTLRGSKALQALIAQMDALFPTLSGKPAADILCEKASIIRQQIQMEQDAEECKAEADKADQSAKISELTSELTAANAKVTSLTAQSARWESLAGERKIEYQPNPQHAAVRGERDALRQLLTDIVRTLVEACPDSCRVETVIKAAVKLFPSCPKIGEVFGDGKFDFRWLQQWLPQFMTATQFDLTREQGSADKRIGRLAQECISVRFPSPVKVAPPVPVPERILMTQEERDVLGMAKLAAAKELTRHIRW